jgi:hypothetical protein
MDRIQSSGEKRTDDVVGADHLHHHRRGTWNVHYTVVILIHVDLDFRFNPSDIQNQSDKFEDLLLVDLPVSDSFFSPSCHRSQNSENFKETHF